MRCQDLDVMGRWWVLLCFVLRVLQWALTEAKEWSVTIPSEINVLTRSCVVIPCTFTHPPSHDPSHIIWYSYSGTKYPIVYSKRPQDVIEPFRGKTEFVGDVKSGNCSLKISHALPAMNEYQLYPWIDPDTVKHKFYHKTVKLKVQDTIPAVQLIVDGNPKEGETVHISCMVVHTCISSPPTLSFGDTSGDVQNNQTDLGQGYWRTESTISFPARASDQGRAVGCWVRHPGRQVAPTWVEVSVHYAPRSVHVSAENSTTLLGESVTLECRSDANPSSSTFLWYLQRDGSVRTLTAREDSITVTDLLHGQNSFYCMAQNVLGMANSSSPFIITVEYKPSISPESSCVIQGHALRCWCKVRSLPSASVEWTVDGTDAHAALSHVEMFSVRQNHTLSGELLFNKTVQHRTVTCRAFNGHGQQEHALLIKAPPQNVSISQRPLRVLEGQSLTLSCSSHAFPEVLSYSWYQVYQDREVQLSEGSDRLHLQVVGRHMGPYRCSARNEIGQSRSPSTLVCVDFAPVISPASSCTLENEQVRCECVVESYPLAAVTWTAPGVQTNRMVSMELSGSLKSTLTGHMWNGHDHLITCHAANKYGQISLQLTHKGSSDTSTSSLAAAGCGAAALVLLIAAILYCTQRRYGPRLKKSSPKNSNVALQVSACIRV
uniref:Ig-like domain-containing protein n=2 Tax=Pygocentrus nattereri TaxID=42514 RepID=A0AAR2K7B2_PYGNA